MAMQTLTIALPDDLHEKLRDRARSSQRSVEEALTDLLIDALPLESTLPRDLDAAIAPLALLNDDALWHAARGGLPADVASELEGLHLQQQRAGSSARESAREALLLRQYERTVLVRAEAAHGRQTESAPGRTILVRAEAARLLHECGQDVSALLHR